MTIDDHNSHGNYYNLNDYYNDYDEDEGNDKKVTFVRLPPPPHLVPLLGWWSETHWLVVAVLLLPYLVMMIIGL